MNTMIGTIPMDAVLTMLNSLSRHDRRWLVEQMAAQVEREDAEAKKNLEELVSNASTRNKEDNELLDAFLANISTFLASSSKFPSIFFSFHLYSMFIL